MVLRASDDIARARSAVRSLIERWIPAGPDANLLESRVLVVVNELARNALRHATGGELRVTWTCGTLTVEVIDEGPGFVDLTQAFAAAGNSTNGGLGLGLAGSRRLADRFEARNRVGGGALVSAMFDARPGSRDAVDSGAA